MADSQKNGNKGFSLIELLIVMAMFAIVMGAIYSTYMHQQKSYMVQESLAAAEQNLRSAMFFLRREIRMAGFDETGGGGGIELAEKDKIRFKLQDVDSTGTSMVSKTIEYGMFDDRPALKRTVDGTSDAVAENIDAIDFIYLDVDGNDLGVGTGTEGEVASSDLARIKFVEITVIAKADYMDIGYTLPATVYQNRLGRDIFTPSEEDEKRYRRRVLKARVMCRNL